MPWVLVFFALCFGFVNAQGSSARIKLSSQLNEISGLAVLNDSILIAINDSGNEPFLYFLDLKGNVVKSTRVSKALNVDWEDLTMDDRGNLYIADAGNNLNQRKDLHFLQVEAQEAFEKDSVIAKEIWYTYSDQLNFPPAKTAWNFNCEAVFWASDSLYLLTKNESKEPKEGTKWNRNPSLYVIPAFPGTHVAKKTDWKSREMFKVKKTGISDLITSSVVKDKKWYVLTYRHLFVSSWSTETSGRTLLYHKKFSKLKQREALTVDHQGTIYIGAEKHPLLGGPYLYIRKP